MLKQIQIDLESLKGDLIQEAGTAVTRMASDIKWLLYHMTGPSSNLFPGGVHITGNRDDVESFSKVMGKEKRYMDAYLKYGLNDSRVLNNRAKLEKAIYDFEKSTGIKWPLK
tara:strand:- start:358 stop:693 length:336 start_codon:yes stop_codon:yes gene_type:complete